MMYTCPSCYKSSGEFPLVVTSYKPFSSAFMDFSPFLSAGPLLLMILMFPFPSSAVQNNIADLSTLLAFKAQISDPYNILSANWTTDTSFCTWIGVSCDRQRQRVVALRIANLPLHGTISPHIANLSFLTHLNFTNNSLAGPIPESLGRLPRLRSISLNQNQLSGSIPHAIFNMSSLTELYLENNNLSGTLPSNSSFYSMLPQIEVLSLSGNKLSGNIPPGLSRCHHLQILSLHDNQFTGTIPWELGNLKELRFLYLRQNNLTGMVPPSLGNLTDLVNINLSYNMLHGSIPGEFGGLSKLKSFIITNTYGITGPIPISFSNVTTLKFLILADNQLTGPIHVHFGGMSRLQSLFLNGNQLSGGLDFLESLQSCRGLEFLDLWQNELEGSFPTTVGNLSSLLQEFIFYENHIHGKIPVELGNLSKLEDLGLGGNELVGTIPYEITMLDQLEWLRLENNRLHGSIPHGLGRLKRLNRLYLFGNRFTGSIPDSLGNVSGLQYLKLGDNELSSEIPHNLWALGVLLELNLSRNFLSGSLSSAVGSISSLDLLDISKNQLSGMIPSSLKNLQMLRFLDLSGNSFNGQIPPSFGGLVNLEVLNLSANDLSGGIPDSLADLRYLRSINLSFNKLEGQIPANGPFLNLSAVSLTGNAALCGAPTLGIPPCSTNTTSSTSRLLVLKYVLPSVMIPIILVVGICIWFKMKRTSFVAPAETPYPDYYRRISYHELVRATENFSEANLLGRGSFGSVYKGCLDDGQVAAIKVLNMETDGASSSFDAECRALRTVRHRNLVKIISTCSNMDFRAIILEFMPNGSLERWLYSYNYCLNLMQRVNIVIGVASALDYLHHHHSEVVLHCDLKPSNVLLDEAMTAHVSDFGIAVLLARDGCSGTTVSRPGTVGYIAPECASTGRASRKGDVYSFGIMLLEVFTRKRPTDPMFFGDSSLRRWVLEGNSNSNSNPTALLEIVDGNLFDEEFVDERPSKVPGAVHVCLSSIFELGLMCSRELPSERPLMKEVASRLQKIKTEYLSSPSTVLNCAS